MESNNPKLYIHIICQSPRICELGVLKYFRFSIAWKNFPPCHVWPTVLLCHHGHSPKRRDCPNFRCTSGITVFAVRIAAITFRSLSGSVCSIRVCSQGSRSIMTRYCWRRPSAQMDSMTGAMRGQQQEDGGMPDFACSRANACRPVLRHSSLDAQFSISMKSDCND